MVNVADEVVKVWQPLQFMSFIKSVKKQMGRQGLARASVQINLLFTISGKKADLKDLLSRSLLKDNVLPHVSGTCKARWGPKSLSDSAAGGGIEFLFFNLGFQQAWDNSVICFL